jgi:undecaprenyl-diphosphatase
MLAVIIPILAAIQGGTMADLIQSWDLSFLSYLRSFHGPVLTCLALIFSTIAWKGWLWWLIIGYSWLKGKRQLAAEIAIALGTATVAGLPLKSIIARARPDLYASQQLNIPMPELLSTTHSFPSGHTLLAAAVAFIVFFKFKNNWRSWAAFVFVALVGLARIYGGYHWPSDVLGSVALGFVAALFARYACQWPIVTRFTAEKTTVVPTAEAGKEEKQLVSR